MNARQPSPMPTRLASLLLPSIVGAAALLVFGCQTLIGIEDRVYDATGGGGGGGGTSGAGTSGGSGATSGSAGTSGSGGTAPSQQCREYCNDVMMHCRGELQMFGSVDACLGVCALLDPGDPLEPAGNTVACRANEAELAGVTQEPEVHCPRAAPGGGDRCGGDCESYCLLLDRACSFSFADCPEKCEAFATPGAYNASHLEGDTLWCRLTHASAAATDSELHCDHAGVLPSAVCVEDPTTPPSCEDYCRAVNVACTDELAVYESSEQCLATCEALEPGTLGDRIVNTVGCRKYHAYAALIGPEDHCPHASPTGDDTCGSDADGVCASYCRIAEVACADEFGQAFDAPEDCLEACASLPAAAKSPGYAVATAESGDTVACRVLHGARAFADPSACPAAFGAAPCSD